MINPRNRAGSKTEQPSEGSHKGNPGESPLSKADRLDHPGGLPKPSKAVLKAFNVKNRELESLDKQLISFSYVSSNDLQEPLRKIQTFSSRILEKEFDNLSANGKEYFARMQKAANRMQRIIDDLVLFSKLNNDKKKFEIVDVGELVREVLKELEPQIKENKVSFEISALGKINMIRNQFWQLIYNLVSNSIKFASPGKRLFVKIKSRIGKGHLLNPEQLEATRKYYELKFEDNGIGFESRFSDRIFEVFQRLHGQDEYEGTGIGLAICKKIVENHYGVICADGQLKKGAIFTIYIPLK
jgi:light-regulated signal transduction histidine kinase (bacteriophytochrome)